MLKDIGILKDKKKKVGPVGRRPALCLWIAPLYFFGLKAFLWS